MISSSQLFSYMGCLSYLASPILGLALQADRSSLDYRQAPYETRILETGTTFGEENNGVWQLIE